MSAPESGTPPKLECFITENPPILMVSFFGVISDATADELKKCQAELVSRKCDSVVVLSFHGTVTVEDTGISHLVELQNAIRANRKNLYLCSVSEELKKRFTDQGAVREGEMVDSLMDVMRILAAPRSK